MESPGVPRDRLIVGTVPTFLTSPYRAAVVVSSEVRLVIAKE